MATSTTGVTGSNFSNYNISNLLDNDGFKLETGQSKQSKAKDVFVNDQKITDLATELATDLGTPGDTAVEAKIEEFIQAKVGNLSATDTLDSFLTNALAELKTIAGSNNKLDTSDFQTTNTSSSGGSSTQNSSSSNDDYGALAYALLSNKGNDKAIANVIQVFTATDQTDADGNVITGKDGKPVKTATISAADAQYIVEFFKSYGLMDNDPNNMSDVELAKLHEAVLSLKEELSGLSPSELAKFNLYDFLKNFKENDEGEKSLEDGLKKLQDSTKKLSEAVKGGLDGLKKAQASGGEYIKGQTAFSSPF